VKNFTQPSPTSPSPGDVGLCKVFLIELTLGYVVGKYELARCTVYKVGRGQRLCNGEKVNIGGGYPWGWGGRGGLCEIFLIELTLGYVVGKYELARCAV